jgi:hypothetical protein
VQDRRPSIGIPQLFLGLLALSIALVWVANIFAGTIHDAKHANDTIVITGSAKVPIASNLLQWSMTVDGSAAEPVAAAREQRTETAEVLAFLHRAGIPQSAISLEVVRSETQVQRIDKHHVKTTFHVYQGVDVSSTEIAIVEAAARNLGDLLVEGVNVQADPLSYINTDLAQAKLEALQKATVDARRRADILINGLGGKLGRLRATSLGVYQIVPRNSTDFADYGVNDTSSRLKDVTAVVSATFAVTR